MKYTYKTLMNYIDGEIKKEDLLYYLSTLGLNPKIVKEDDDDFIFELETPANRPDLLSFIGLAKEILPFTKISLKDFKEKTIEEKITDFIPVEIENENDCPYYSCRIIKNIDNPPSPEEFKKILENIGFRSSFYIVDISNFVMCETGQPLHIFDLDKIKGKIIVRKGRKGEKIITIDGKEREVEDVLIIADKEKPIAIAGIMGGLNTEVTQNTKNILIESAYFNPVIIRKGSKKLGLVTEASLRFEKGLSISMAKIGMERVTRMIKKYCGGEIGKQNFGGTNTISENKIYVNKENIEKVLGIKIEKEFIKNLFNRNDFTVEEKDNSLILKIPEYRKDLKEEIDIIEEVAKYKKYSEINLEMPIVNIQPFSLNSSYEIFKKIKNILINLGFWEVITLSFISDEIVERFNLEAIKIENPLSQMFSFLRNSLIFNLFEVVKYNISYQNRKFEIFELGRIYKKEENKYIELDSVMLISLNSGSFFDFKGKIECFFEKCGLKEIKYIKNNYFLSQNENNCDIYFSNEKIGNLFIPLDELKNFYKINDEIYVCEIFLDKLLKYLSFEKKFKQLPKFPSSQRDFSFLFSEDINWEEIESSIKKLDLPIEKLEVFDIYKGKHIPSGKISISFSITFRSSEKTFENEEINIFEKDIIEMIEKKFNGILRGKNV